MHAARSIANGGISMKLVLISQCPDRRKWHFRGSSFQNFPGEVPPDPPTTLAPAALEAGPNIFGWLRHWIV